MLRLGVELINTRLNRDFEDYAFANKTLASAWAELHCSEEVLIFCDSDQVILREPTLLGLGENEVAAVQTVFLRGIGVTNAADIEGEYWTQLAAKVGVDPTATAEDWLTGSKIWPYWNGGLIAVLRDAGVFTEWERLFRWAMETGVQPSKGKFFVEQSILAATLWPFGERVRTLPRAYNYPLELHSKLGTERGAQGLDELVTAHYRTLFNTGGLDPIVRLPNPRAARSTYDWLNANLQTSGVCDNPFEDMWVAVLREAARDPSLFAPKG